MDVDSCDGRSSSMALSSTAVGDTTDSVTVGVDGTRSLGESSTVPGRATVGDVNGSVAIDTGGVGRTRFEAATGGEIGSVNVISRTRTVNWN